MKIFLFLILFFVNILFANGDIILTSIGFGNNLENAKKNALKSISENLFSEVSSITELENLNSNYHNYHYGFSSTKIKSQMIFQKINFRIIKNQKNNFKVKAIFDRDSLIYSIKFLISETKINYDLLKNKEDFYKQEKYLQMLSVLFPYILNRSKRIEVKKFIIKKKKSLYEHLNFEYVLFSFNNFDTHNVIITIDNNKYNTINKRIYLSNGEHFYKIYKKGYFLKEGTFFLKNKKNVFLNITLFKKHSKAFSLNLNDKVYYQNIKNIFNNNHLYISNRKHNSYFDIIIKESSSKINVYGLNLNKIFIEIRYFDKDKIIFSKVYEQNIASYVKDKFIREKIQEFIEIFYLKVIN